MITFEEEEEELGGGYGTWANEPEEDEPFLNDFSPPERRMIKGFDRRARRYSKRGAQYHAWHLTLSIISIVAAALVPVVIAVAAPTWIAAVAGAVTAIAQGVLQVTRVDQHSVEIHSMLVRLTARRDQLKADVRRSRLRADRSALANAYEIDVIALTSELSARLVSLDRPERGAKAASADSHP
jgi:hypothetical protein